MYPKSLNRHLLRMKAAGALDGLPAYWPHLTRAVAGNYLEGRLDIPAAQARRDPDNVKAEALAHLAQGVHHNLQSGPMNGRSGILTNGSFARKKRSVDA